MEVLRKLTYYVRFSGETMCIKYYFRLDTYILAVKNKIGSPLGKSFLIDPHNESLALA